MAHPFKPADADELARRGLNPDGTPLKAKKPKAPKAAAPQTPEAPTEE